MPRHPYTPIDIIPGLFEILLDHARGVGRADRLRPGGQPLAHKREIIRTILVRHAFDCQRRNPKAPVDLHGLVEGDLDPHHVQELLYAYREERDADLRPKLAHPQPAA